jgi:PhzF family phenazine biosynthesis protein
MPPLFIVDAFTDRPFAGNPAAVCLLDGPADDRWMQALAAEMNLSETAFVVPRDDGFGLRWMTPQVEVDLCGHATLASAHVLWQEGRVRSDQPIVFHTRSGALTCVRRESAGPALRGETSDSRSESPALIEMDFPANPPRPVAPPLDLSRAMGIEPLWVGQTRFDYFLELPSAEEVRRLQPDIRLLKVLKIRGVIITARSDRPEFDFVSRFFAPGAGIDEDPVTGSAHCALGPFWAERLGRTELVAFQASRRGGVVRVRVRGERVTLGGQAVTVLRGSVAGVEDV